MRELSVWIRKRRMSRLVTDTRTDGHVNIVLEFCEVWTEFATKSIKVIKDQFVKSWRIYNKMSVMLFPGDNIVLCYCLVTRGGTIREGSVTYFRTHLNIWLKDKTYKTPHPPPLAYKSQSQMQVLKDLKRIMQSLILALVGRQQILRRDQGTQRPLPYRWHLLLLVFSKKVNWIWS